MFTYLKALVLSFSDPISIFYLSYNFTDDFFLALHTLRLQHVQFSAAHNAECLVTCHINTLLKLHLAHCWIAVAHNNSKNPQAAITGAVTAVRTTRGGPVVA
jgi:hypothetical protein